LEKEDLDVHLSFGFVCFGKLGRCVEIRKLIREQFPDVKMVYNSVSGEHLFLLKESALNEEQVKMLKEKEGKKEK
jgi:hypothetical protein